MRVIVFYRFFPGMALQRAMNRTHEDEIELRLLPVLADPNRVSIDVGANIGKYTAKLIPLSRLVIAIEPHPRLAHGLSAFSTEGVTVHQAIASQIAGQTLELEVEQTRTGESDALGHVAITGQTSDNAKLYPVTTVTLDGCSLDPVGFAKIDVEGHELEVLEGAAGLIARDAPVFLVETETRHRREAPKDIFAFFAKRSYRGFFIHDRRPHPVEDFEPSMQDERELLGYTTRESARYVNNFIFLPPERDVTAVMARCLELLAFSAGEPEK